ncbi:uncharacterized protein V6R79_017003 [Siganus canaliculatus]
MSFNTGIEEMHLCLARLILLLIPVLCKDLNTNTCDVFPKDLYIEEGADAEILCLTTCTRHRVYWTLDGTLMDERMSQANSTHSVLLLRNFTRRSAVVECHRDDYKQIVGGIHIRTYSKPSKISCILHDKTRVYGLPQFFKCSWEHRTDSSERINYTVILTSSSSQSEICRSLETMCESNYSEIYNKMHFQNVDYNLTVRAESADWKVSSEPYTFTPIKITKLFRPMLSVTAVSDGLLVKCFYHQLVNRNKYQHHCQVKYSQAGEKGAVTHVLNETIGKELTVENLESCQNYTFAGRCALDQAPWSDWSNEKTVLTRLKKRDVELRLWRKTEAEQDGVRKVRVMWKEIPSTCQETFNYTIKQTPCENRGSEVKAVGVLCGKQFCDVDQEAHRINLTVLHDELLLEDSVYIPAIREKLPRVTDIQTSALGGVMLVRWKAPAEPITGYMVDYTHDRSQYRWEETPYPNVTLFGLLDKTPYDITVTPLLDDRTGHDAQALHICSGFGDPGNVSITYIESKDRSAVVKWTLKSQEACSGAVVNYTIFYYSSPGSLLNVTVDNKTHEISLKDLDPETYYNIYVMATALTGTTSSTERVLITKKFDPNLSTTLGVGGGVLIVVVLSLGFYCVVQWKKFKERPVPNPGHSSVALWPSSNEEKGICSLRPFHSPSESFCNQIYTEETQSVSVSPVSSMCNENSLQGQRGEVSEPEWVVHTESPAEAQPLCFPGESTEPLLSENGPSSPYRCQSPVEAPALRINKAGKRVPAKQQEKTPPPTAYVTLDILEQGHSR